MRGPYEVTDGDGAYYVVGKNNMQVGGTHRTRAEAKLTADLLNEAWLDGYGEGQADGQRQALRDTSLA